jgi:single-strand DNA-binding protein
MSINRVIISGNLTRDAEMRATNTGLQVAAFGVAVNDRTKNPTTGDWEDRPNFFDVSMFGTRAEKIAPYLRKGTKVAIEGRLRYRAWESPAGEKRSKVEIVVDEIEFMSSRDASAGGADYAAAPEAEAEVAGEEIPF